jgi:hypothetical protein
MAAGPTSSPTHESGPQRQCSADESTALINPKSLRGCLIVTLVLNPFLASQRDLCLIFNFKRNGDRAALWGSLARKGASPFRVFELSRASNQIQFPLSGSLTCAA